MHNGTVPDWNKMWETLQGAPLQILIIVITAVIIRWLSVRILNRVIRRMAAQGRRERLGETRRAERTQELSEVLMNQRRQQRAEAIGALLRSVFTATVVIIALLLILPILGINVGPLLASAGVLGVALGFGAQSLVKDYFTGFFLLLENQISTGDIVQLSSDHAGLVEEVTLRYVRLRDYDGRVHFVPNGQISSVINSTRGHSFAVLDIGVAYRENVDEVMAVMHEVAREMRADAAYAEHILEDLDMAGVDQWGDSAVVIKCRFKVVAMRQWVVRREYLRRLKNTFDARGIEIPFPHLTVYAGQDKQGHAPVLPLQLQRVGAAQRG